MDMTKEALSYIVGMKEPKIVEAFGEQYSDKPLTRVDKELRADPLKMKTLTSLIDYINAGIDSTKGNMIVHVVAPDCVKLVSCLDADRQRETLVEVHAEIPDFSYGSFMDHETFLISLQAKFLPGNDRDLLLKFAGTVENGTVAQYGDDGVSQKATIKTGIASKADYVVPNPVLLTPYRTFMEVEQPESSFIFRMKDDERSGVRCAIFEADGGAWKKAAMVRVAEFIREQLHGREGFTVIY